MSECHPRPSTRGHTLTEALLVIALLGGLLASGIPSLQAYLLRRHLQGQSAQWLADLQYLRASAVGRNEPLRLSWLRGGGGSGWAIHSGDADACRADGDAAQPIRCTGGATLLRSAWLPAGSQVAVQANVASMRVDPRQGTVTPTGSWELATPDGVRLRHVVNLLGRARVCAPASPVAGVAAC
jgi:type IV fimbrial biogenesis protein FimT